MQEMQIQLLGWANPLEKETANHYSILAWENPWTEEPVGLRSLGSQKSWTQRLNNSNNSLLAIHKMLPF